MRNLNFKPATWNFTETRTLPCGCVIDWDPERFEHMRKVGLEHAEPGEEPLSEERVLRNWSHVCPKDPP